MAQLRFKRPEQRDFENEGFTFAIGTNAPNIGDKTRRFFREDGKERIYDGKIVAFYDAEACGEGVDLWKNEHKRRTSDKPTLEDLDEHEMKAAILAFETNLQKPPDGDEYAEFAEREEEGEDEDAGEGESEDEDEDVGAGEDEGGGLDPDQDIY